MRIRSSSRRASAIFHLRRVLKLMSLPSRNPGPFSKDGPSYQRPTLLTFDPTEDLLKGKGSYTETLIYKIEKRRVVDGTPGPVVQTFYIPRVPGRNGFRYIDSQVFYGIQYQYDISPINLVIGSAWTYNDILLHYGGSLQLGTGHALGNALGFYLETGPPALVHPPATGAHLEESEDTQIAVATVPDNTELAGTFVFKLPSPSPPSSGQGPDVLLRLVGQDLNVPNSTRSVQSHRLRLGQPIHVPNRRHVAHRGGSRGPGS